MTAPLALHRAAAPDRQKVEVRQDIDRNITDVIDAVARASRASRSEMVESILAAWARRKLMEATLVERLSRGNGPVSESLGDLSE